MAERSMGDALASWLAEPAQLGREVTIADLHRIATGHSRAMWFLALAGAGGGAGERFVVRVDQGGVFGTSGVLEFPFMRAAGRLGCPVASVRWLEPTGDVLGHPFFVMDFVESTVAAREDRTLPDVVARDFVRQLDALHRADWRDAFTGAFTAAGVVGAPEDATHDQIERWAGVYRSTTREWVPLLDEAAAWLHHHAPAIAPDDPSIVHGDPGPGNFLHDGTAVVALTDWEFAHLGDPMEDWAYLIAMRGARTMSAEAWCALIVEITGVTVTDWHLRYWSAFNFFKGACANLTCLTAFAGSNPAPNMAIIGTALQQTFLRRLADLVTA